MIKVNKECLVEKVEEYLSQLSSIMIPFPYSSDDLIIRLKPGEYDLEFLCIKDNEITIQGDNAIKSLEDSDYSSIMHELLHKALPHKYLDLKSGSYISLFKEILSKKLNRDYDPMLEEILNGQSFDYEAILCEEFYVELFTAVNVNGTIRQKRIKMFSDLLGKYKDNSLAFTKILSNLIGGIAGEYLVQKHGSETIDYLKESLKVNGEQSYKELLKDDFGEYLTNHSLF